MRKELEQEIIARWSQWFNTVGDVSHTAMPRGFPHGDGWFDILWRLCGDLEPLVEQFEQESGCQIEILQVKEKFGGLRVYVSGANDAMRQRLEAAQNGIDSHLPGLSATGSTAGRWLDQDFVRRAYNYQLIQTAQTDPHSTS